MTAIIWKVDPLPSPAVRNSPINTRKNAVKLPEPEPGRVRNSRAVKTAIKTKLISVTRTPPSLSEITPPADRASAPSSGPKKARCRMLTSGNWVFDSIANPAEKPINEPKVAR
ncbi:hypothetical protein D3C75_898500 [compost metagenome]